MTINGTNYTKIRIGKGFKDVLLAPIPLKDPIENDSSIENGVRYIVNTHKKARDLTLEFQVVGTSTSDFEAQKTALFTEFYKGTFVLSNLGFTNEVFHLVYLGKTPTYSSGLSNRACKVSASFKEYDPTNRT